MTAFSTIPGLIITSETSVIPDDGRAIRHAEGGQLRGRNAYIETVYRMTVIVKGDLTVKQALNAFYTANVNSLNIINIDGTNYRSLFSEPPEVTGKDGDIRWLSFGLIGFDADAPTPVAGLVAVGSVGAVVVSLPTAIIVSGVVGTSAVGSVTVDAQTIALVSGVASTGVVGSITVEAKAVVTPLGIAGTGAVGTVTVTTS